MPKPFSTILSLFTEANMLDAEHVSAVLSECTKRQITPGEFLFSSGAMKPEVIRAAILTQLLLKERLITQATAIKAIQKATNFNCPLEEALEKCDWDKRYAEHVKLVADLLSNSGIISRDQKEELLDICLDSRLPITKLLLERRAINDFTADFILAVTVLLKKEAISFEQAVKLIKLTGSHNCSLEEALDMCQIHPAHHVKSIKLGELLLAADFVSAKQLMSAIELGLIQRKRLGEILVSEGLISNNQLRAALAIQDGIRRSLISAADGISQLRSIDNPDS